MLAILTIGPSVESNSADTVVADTTLEGSVSNRKTGEGREEVHIL